MGKFSTIATFLFLAALLEGVSADESNSWGEWWDSIKQTFSNVTDAVTTTLACTKDWGDMLQADPALADASKAYEATYGYTDTNNVDGTTQEQIETTTMTYSADAMASYKAACEASTADAVWWELPTGTTVSCATTDGSYTFDIAYENLGDCWPTTDACSAYATGAQAFPMLPLPLMMLMLPLSPCHRLMLLWQPKKIQHRLTSHRRPWLRLLPERLWQ